MKKHSKIITPLKPHQERVIEKLKKDDQPGLVVVHGLGSGKSLSSIAAHDAIGKPGTAVVPAALQANYQKEISRHRSNGPKTNISTMQAIANRGEPPSDDVLIVDEAHRLRDPSSKSYQAISKSKAKKRILLTGTPFYNRPYDIAPLVNLAAGQKVLPQNRTEFDQKYITEKKIKPGIFGRLRGVKPGTVTSLNPKKEKELQTILNKWVDYYEGSKEGFPEVKKEDVKVPMSEHQRQIYDTVIKQAPDWVSYKIKRGLPPSKKESKQLNAFLGAVRQISNTTAPYDIKNKPESPKINKAFEELSKKLRENPRAKGVVYSNYLQAGIKPYKDLLVKAKIPFGEFTGEMNRSQRDALVKDYNENRIRALLLSSAGGEGLDLKGTRLLQILDPHWNEEKIKQVEGRGARYMSHAGLPPEEQNITVQRYLSTRPKRGMLERLGLKKPGMGVDEYLTEMSKGKENLNAQFRNLLRKQQAHV